MSGEGRGFSKVEEGEPVETRGRSSGGREKLAWRRDCTNGGKTHYTALVLTWHTGLTIKSCPDHQGDKSAAGARDKTRQEIKRTSSRSIVKTRRILESH